MCPRTQLIGDKHPVHSSPCRSCGDPLRANPPWLHGTNALWAEITVTIAMGRNTVSSIYWYIPLEPRHRSRSGVCLVATVDWRAVLWVLSGTGHRFSMSYSPSRLSVRNFLPSFRAMNRSWKKKANRSPQHIHLFSISAWHLHCAC